MKLCALASGSSGNSTFVSTDSTRILVDVGISVSQLKKRLTAIGEYLGGIDAVLITHEHLDHTGGLATLRMDRGFHGRIYVEEDLANVSITRPISRVGPFEKVFHFKRGIPFGIGDILIQPLATPHDAVAPAAFVLSSGMSRVAVVTDLGHVPVGFGELLAGTDVLLLESNHDPDMLAVGPYVEHLRSRVLGDRGHLSNGQVAAFIRDEMLWGTPHLLLGHISENSNDPRLVHMVASCAIAKRELSTKLTVIEHGCQSEIFLC